MRVLVCFFGMGASFFLLLLNVKPAPFVPEQQFPESVNSLPFWFSSFPEAINLPNGFFW